MLDFLRTYRRAARPGRMRLTQLEYDLPEDLIAREPLEPRDQARMLVLDREKN